MDRCPSYSKADIDIETGAHQYLAQKQGNTSVSPPPYEHQEAPTYNSLTTPAPMSCPLVQYLCLIGFLCPILWVVGALVLVSPLRKIFLWMFSSETEVAIHNEEARRTRKTEMKWASTCLILVSLFCLVGTVIFMVHFTAKDAS